MGILTAKVIVAGGFTLAVDVKVCPVVSSWYDNGGVRKNDNSKNALMSSFQN